MSTCRHLSLRLMTFSEAAAPDRRNLVRDVSISPEMRNCLQQVVARLADHADLKSLRSQGAVDQAGSLDQIDILLVDQKDISDIFGLDGVLGMHLITTPEGDPFADGTNYACAYRILLAWDPDALARLLLDEWEEDGFQSPEDAALSWLSTLGHEIHHVVLFAENGNFNAPEDLDRMSMQIGHDLFDMSTGYGIRPACVHGIEIEPENAEHAQDLMEEMVEERGLRMCYPLLWPQAEMLVDLFEADRYPSPS